MIKAHELRVGNWVNNNEENYPITSATIVGLERGDFNVKPILLTEEWLLRLGFEKYQWTNAYFLKTKYGDLMIRFFENSIYSFFTNVHYDSQGMKFSKQRYIGNLNSTENIKYVHTLQNLYFALTGKELEIKEK